LRGRKFARVHLDVDTTVEPLFGCQQGAVPGPVWSALPLEADERRSCNGRCVKSRAP
jgi:hypothetical protein